MLSSVLGNWLKTLTVNFFMKVYVISTLKIENSNIFLKIIT